MYSLPFFGIIGGVGLPTVEGYIRSLNTNLWLDGADSTRVLLCQANTTLVCDWLDKSGRGNNASQSTVNNQPNYINNRVSFTGTRFLDVTNNQVFNANTISGTLFIVVRRPTSTAGGWGRFSTNATSNRTPGSDGNTFIENFLASASSSYTIPNRTPTIPLPWTIINFAHTGSALGIRLNGGTAEFRNVGLTVPTTALGQQRIGGQVGDFDIYEILMFPSSISSDDRLIIEGYLAHKWGLTSLLPLGHRYRDSLQGAFNTSFFSIQANEPFLPVSLPTLAIAATSATKLEGNTGTTAFTFTVTRSGNTANISSVSWAVTGSGTNQANAADFAGGVFPSGTLTFDAGITSGLITVNVQGDTAVEQDEQFTVTLSNPVDAVISTATANVVILNDDAP